MRLLIATGGSTHSETAVRLGMLIAPLTSAPPTVLTVVRYREDQPDAGALLAHAVALLTPAVSEFMTKVRVGRPDEQIVQEAKEGRYDLILLGERTHHDLLKRLLGPTAQRVIAHAPCPVMIAKEKVRPLKRILLCDSGATTPSLLHRVREQLPELLQNAVEATVLHVMSQISAGPGVAGKQLRATAEELIGEQTPEGKLLAQDIEALQWTSIPARPKVRHGFVVDEILAEAKSGNYDLIVIGAHHSEGWPHFLLEDLARQIVVQADRPILVIP